MGERIDSSYIDDSKSRLVAELAAAREVCEAAHEVRRQRIECGPAGVTSEAWDRLDKALDAVRGGKGDG